MHKARSAMLSLVVIGAVTAGCGGGGDSSSSSSSAAAPAAASTDAPMSSTMSGSSDMASSMAESMTDATTAMAAGSTAMAAGSTAMAAAPADTPAAQLRSGLTALLQEHVYLAGIAVHATLLAKGDTTAPAAKAAIAALDANSVALSKAVGSAYPDAEAPFLDSWRQHIGFFVDYAIGKATNDDAKVTKAKTDLDGYRTAFGQLINSVIPTLPADAVAQELVPHVQTLLAAIDADVAGDPSVYGKLQTAAGHMPMTAATLANGIAADKGLS